MAGACALARGGGGGPELQGAGGRAAVEGKWVVGLSPVIRGASVRGMADACLTAIGVETSAQAVGRHYGNPLLNGGLVDTADDGASIPGVTVVLGLIVRWTGNS